jgi:hypothetical protein
VYDRRENGQPVVIAGGSEPALALAGAVSEISGAILFYCGAGALGSLVANSAFEGAVRAGDPVVVVFSNPEEAFELRGRVSKFARTGAVATLQQHSQRR